MQAYSLDLRQRVLALVDDGLLSRPEIAELLHVSTAWIRRLVQVRRQCGRIAPKEYCRRGPEPKLQHDHRLRLQQLVRDDPDATIAELHERLGAEVSRATVGRALLQLGLTRKKIGASQ